MFKKLWVHQSIFNPNKRWITIANNIDSYSDYERVNYIGDVFIIPKENIFNPEKESFYNDYRLLCLLN